MLIGTSRLHRKPAIGTLHGSRSTAGGGEPADFQCARTAQADGCAGAQLEHYFPVSIPSHGGALNITVQSYMDNLDFGLIGCRAAVPDTQNMADMLRQEFDTLKQAAHLLEEAP
jgi:hypothetical protein